MNFICNTGCKITMNPIIIDEIIFNFAHKCTMKCSFCYIPFDTNIVNKKYCFKILKRLKEINPNKLTIGGGDPLSYSFLPELLNEAKNNFNDIHLDTSGINFNMHNKEKITLILDSISQIGLPLDGHNSEIHGKMRDNYTHFDIVIEILNYLSKHHIQVNIKINTVLSKINETSIYHITKIINNFNVVQWSIFQFWSISNNNINNKYNIKEDDFKTIVKLIKKDFPKIPIKALAISKRKNNYFFVKHNGDVYTVSKKNDNQYNFIGSIFQSNILDIWQEAINTESIQQSIVANK